MKKARRRVIYLTYGAARPIRYPQFQFGRQCLRHVKGQGSNGARAPAFCNADGSGISLSNYSSSNICMNSRKLSGMLKIYTNSAWGYKEVLVKIFCLEFVSGIAHQAFTNGLALKVIKDPPDLMTNVSPSACPKSFVPNDAIVKAFSRWANEHLENWSANAQTGVMQAMRDTWPCL